MIKTIIFDIGNVLTYYDWEGFLNSFGYDKEITNRIAKASIMDSVWNEFDLGLITDEEILSHFIKNDPEIEMQLRTVYTNIHGIVRKADYAIPWIKELKKRGYQVLYLSNFSKKALVECADALDFINETDGGILSFRERVIKPMPKIYQLLIERFNLNPEKCIFLDDLPQNLEGAKRFGIKTLQFTTYDVTKNELEKSLNDGK